MTSIKSILKTVATVYGVIALLFYSIIGISILMLGGVEEFYSFYEDIFVSLKNVFQRTSERIINMRSKLSA